MIEFDENTGLSTAHLEYLEGRKALEYEDYARASALLQQSRERDLHYKTSFLLSVALSKLGETESSFSFLREAYELNPNSSQVSVEYAREMARRYNKRIAVEILKRTLARNSDYRPAKSLLSTLTEI